MLYTVPFFSFHHVNAYEVPGQGSGGSDLLVVDTVAWDDVAFDVNQHNVTSGFFDGGCR